MNLETFQQAEVVYHMSCLCCRLGLFRGGHIHENDGSRG